MIYLREELHGETNKKYFRKANKRLTLIVCSAILYERVYGYFLFSAAKERVKYRSNR